MDEPGVRPALGDDCCSGCDRTLRWIDARHACPNGCVYCDECATDVGVGCAACGEPLRRLGARARPLPGR